MEKEDFVVGKYYKKLSSYNFIAKFSHFDGSSFGTEGEWIDGDKYHKKSGKVRITSDWTSAVECPYEEYSKYLPDGHPDKIIKDEYFIPGKWYIVDYENEIKKWVIIFKCLNSSKGYVNFANIEYFYPHERKSNSANSIDFKNESIKYFNVKELSLEQVQEHLPDNHQDKIKIMEPKRKEPTFIKGRWYKRIEPKGFKWNNGYIWYLRASEHRPGKHEIEYTQRINYPGKHEDMLTYAHDANWLLVENSEISDYLPEGHEDKIKKPNESRFVVGAWYKLGSAKSNVIEDWYIKFSGVSNTGIVTANRYIHKGNASVDGKFGNIGDYELVPIDSFIFPNLHWDVIYKAFPDEKPQPELKVGDWIYFLKSFDGKKEGDVREITAIRPEEHSSYPKGWISYNDGGFRWEGNGFYLNTHFRMALSSEIAKPGYVEEPIRVFPQLGDYITVEGINHLKGRTMIGRYENEYVPDAPKDYDRCSGPLISDFNAMRDGQFEYKLEAGFAYKGNGRTCRPSTPEEIQWLKVCISANQFVKFESTKKPDEHCLSFKELLEGSIYHCLAGESNRPYMMQKKAGNASCDNIDVNLKVWHKGSGGFSSEYNKFRVATTEEQVWFKACQSTNSYISKEVALQPVKKETFIHESWVGRWFKRVSDGHGLLAGEYDRVIKDIDNEYVELEKYGKCTKTPSPDLFEVMPIGFTPKIDLTPPSKLPKNPVMKAKVGDRVRIVDARSTTGCELINGSLYYVVKSMDSYISCAHQKGGERVRGGDILHSGYEIVEESKPMNKFKVGDKVIGNSMEYGITLKGWKGTVTKVEGEHSIKVKGPGVTDGVTVYAKDFDLLSSAESIPDRLTGRWLKALIDRPDGIGSLKQGQYVQIQNERGDLEPLVLYDNSKGWAYDKAGIGRVWELMPEGWFPEYNTSKPTTFDPITFQPRYQYPLTSKEVISKHSKFKIGDWVKRVSNSHLGMEVGDVDRVIGLEAGGLILENYRHKVSKDGTHDPAYFVLASVLEIPKVYENLPTTKEEAIIAEAKLRYPIGCLVDSLGGSRNVPVLSHDFFWTDVNKDRLRLTDDLLIYRQGKWAKIVQAAGNNSIQIDAEVTNLKLPKSKSVTLKSADKEVTISIRSQKSVKIN